MRSLAEEFTQTKGKRVMRLLLLFALLTVGCTPFGKNYIVVRQNRNPTPKCFLVKNAVIANRGSYLEWYYPDNRHVSVYGRYAYISVKNDDWVSAARFMRVDLLQCIR